MDATTDLLTQVLDEIDCGLLLLTRSGRLCQANRVADHRWLAARELELDAAGRVTAHHAADRPRLATGLAQALAGRRSLVTLWREGVPLTLACVPLHAPDEAADAPAVLLICGRPAGCNALSAAFFAQAHGLTAAEAGVLRALQAGATPAAAASASGVALTTVRSHIGALRAKTGTHSINELLQRLTALPPMAPAGAMLQ